MDKFNIPQEQFNSVVMDLLISTRIELDTLRNLIVVEYARRAGEDINSLNDSYKALQSDSRDTILAQIKCGYGLGQSIDDILNSVS